MTHSIAMKRTDLLELTPEALTALANAGFVKRAQKEVNDGQIPALNEADDGTLSARYSDGTTTTLAPHATLRDAQCSCPASGMCRHRVLMVLAYQRLALEKKSLDNETPASTANTNCTQENNAQFATPTREPAADTASEYWTPAIFEAAIASFPAAVRKQAEAFASEHPVVHLTAWQAAAPIPGARLPMCNVRFFSRHNVAHARCDCKQGSGCAHIVVAVWGFLQAQQRQPGFTSLSLEVKPPMVDSAAARSNKKRGTESLEQQLQTSIVTLTLQLWLEGSRQSLLGLDAKFEQAIAYADQLGWLWISETLHDLRHGIQAQQARSNRADPVELLKALAYLHARLQAAHYSEQVEEHSIPAMPASQILGLGVKGEVALDHLRLVSLGAQAWADTQEEGASLLFVDPDTLAVTVIERSWPRAKAGEPYTALRDRRVAGQPLRALAASQIVTKAAKRRANGRLEIGTGARNTNVMPLSARAWEDIGSPVRQPDANALRQHLLQAIPGFVGPRQAVEHLHILPVVEVLDWGWDAAKQCLFAEILTAQINSPLTPDTDGDASSESERDQTVTLILRHDALTPQAVDAAACALNGQWGALTAVAGIARINAMQLQLEPLSLLTEQKALVPAFENVEKQAMEIKPLPLLGSPLSAMVDNTLALLAQWLRQGLRHQGAQALQRGEAQASNLAEAGLTHSAQCLRSAMQMLVSSEHQTLPEAMANLTLLLEEITRVTDTTHGK